MADEPMSDEPMTDDEVMERINRAGLDPYGMLGGQDRLIARLNRLQAEADSLRAREAAAMAIAEKLVSLWLVTDDSHAPKRLTYLYSRDGAVDVETLREEARALLAEE